VTPRITYSAARDAVHELSTLALPFTGVASRIIRDHLNRRIVEVTSVTDIGARRGMRFLLVGDSIECGGRAVFFMADRRHGRPATVAERETAGRFAALPGAATRKDREAKQLQEDVLDEQAALEACRREQETDPADLVNVAA
jgi:hypothetical protein